MPRDPNGVLWDDEHPMGHAPYCELPAHSTLYYCRAGRDENGDLIMHSDAYKRDRPEQFPDHQPEEATA